MVDGQKIKIKGLGHASDVFQSLAGDLLLNVKVKQHQIFHKEGLNITSEIPISIIEAILGSKVTVLTLDGQMNIEVKPGTNSGQ